MKKTDCMQYNSLACLQNIARLSLTLVFCLAMHACLSSGSKSKTFTVRNLHGNLLIRDIGSDAQVSAGGAVLDAKGSIPVSGVPSPVSVYAEMRGLLSVNDIVIENVTGNVVIERALTGTQNVPLESAIKALYESGDPFGSWEITEE